MKEASNEAPNHLENILSKAQEDVYSQRQFGIPTSAAKGNPKHIEVSIGKPA